MSPTWKPWSCCLEMNWRSGQITALASSSERISCFLSTMVVFALSSSLVFRNKVCVSCCKIADYQRISCKRVPFCVARFSRLLRRHHSRLPTSRLNSNRMSQQNTIIILSSASASISLMGMNGTLLQHCRVPEATVWCRFILQTRVCVLRIIRLGIITCS